MPVCSLHIDDLPPRKLIRSRNGYKYVIRRGNVYRAQAYAPDSKSLVFLGGYRYAPVAAYAVSVFLEAPSGLDKSITSRCMIGMLKGMALCFGIQSSIGLIAEKANMEHGRSALKKSCASSLSSFPLLPLLSISPSFEPSSIEAVVVRIEDDGYTSSAERDLEHCSSKSSEAHSMFHVPCDDPGTRLERTRLLPRSHSPILIQELD